MPNKISNFPIFVYFLLVILIGEQSIAQMNKNNASSKNTMLKIYTTNREKLDGRLTNFFSDTLFMEQGIFQQLNRQPVLEQFPVALNKIKSISIQRKSPFGKYLARWVLIPFALGFVIGISSGDDPPGWFSMTAEQKAVSMGTVLGFLGLNIAGTIGVLKGVDIDIPWDKKNLNDKRLILFRLLTREYHSPHPVRFSPWAGVSYPADGGKAYFFGGRFCCYFNQRSGFEFSVATSNWYSTDKDQDVFWQTDKIKSNIFTGCFFISFTRDRKINPFVVWGLGLTANKVHRSEIWEYNDNENNLVQEIVTSRDDERHLAQMIFFGAEMPLTDWLSFEGRVGEILELDEGLNLSYQLALTFGRMY